MKTLVTTSYGLFVRFKVLSLHDTKSIHQSVKNGVKMLTNPKDACNWVVMGFGLDETDKIQVLLLYHHTYQHSKKHIRAVSSNPFRHSEK